MALFAFSVDSCRHVNLRQLCSAKEFFKMLCDFYVSISSDVCKEVWSGHSSC